MSLKIAYLRKGVSTLRASKWLLTSMLPEVITEVARSLENLVTALIQALEIVAVSLRLGVLDLDHSMPVVWNAFEMLLRDGAMHQVAYDLNLIVCILLSLHVKVLWVSSLWQVLSCVNILTRHVILNPKERLGVLAPQLTLYLCLKCHVSIIHE